MKPAFRLATACCLASLAHASSVQGEKPGALVAASGLSVIPFEHFNGMTGKLYFPEMTGQGAALFDYDGDGDLDAYFVQGARLGEVPAAGSSTHDSERPVPRDVLFRNDMNGAEPSWLDVTTRARLQAEGYGMAVATGDVDGDGWPDLLVGNYGANQLWRNRGDGTFVDASSGLDEGAPRWTTGAAFVDYDGDGLQDLYLVNYVDYSVAEAPTCYATSSRQDYCGPSSFRSQPDRLLRNTGDGSFVDVTALTGVGTVAGSGLGVAVLDADGDGGLDLYVSNDGQPNFLWRLDRGLWTEDALLAGVAVNARGEPEAGMGIAVGDYDRDGDEDILVAHLTGETNTLYINEGMGLFSDLSNESGLAAPSLPYTAFGAVWVDLDHDGWLDLGVANGAVRIQEGAAAMDESYPLAQANQLFANRRGHFVEIEDSSFSAAGAVSRGLIRGDVDNDGDHDLLVTNNAGASGLFFNAAAGEANWLGVVFARAEHQRVVAVYEDGARVVARASSAGSYASAADSRIVLGGAEPPRTLSITGAGQEGKTGKPMRLVSPPTGKYLRYDYR